MGVPWAVVIVKLHKRHLRVIRIVFDNGHSAVANLLKRDDRPYTGIPSLVGRTACCLLLTLCVLACMLLTLSSPSPILAQMGFGIVRVAPTGTDFSGCGAASAPCNTIQYAVGEATTGDVILVAAGTYRYDSSNDVCIDPLKTTGVVCIVNRRITILGGYTTTNWISANPTANVTIIDGENTQRGVLLISTGPPTSLRIEGFTIRRGVGRGITGRPPPENIFGFGGGMLVELASVVLRNMIFEDNQAVGENVATESGGTGSGGGFAIKLGDGTSTLENITFKNNLALGGTGLQRGGLAIGGGLYTYRSTLTGSNIILLNNSATAGNSAGLGSTGDRGRADAQGGGATFQDGSNITLQYVTAIGNQATGGVALTNGGGAFGGAIHVESNQFPTTFTLLDSDLRGNVAQGGNAGNGGLGNGGAIEALNSTLTINRVLMINNTARGGNGLTGNTGSAGGGAVNFVRLRSDSTTISIINSVFADNLSTMGTTGMEVGGGGGAIWLQGVTAEMVHTTVARNRLGSVAMQGQAILLLNDGVPTPAVANISYSIIADHTGFDSSVSALHVKPGNTVTLKSGLYAGNTRDDNSSGIPHAAGTFNGLASMMSAATAGFISAGTPNYNYHILMNSPAKDLAVGSSTALDLDRDMRPFGPAADIGADEYVPFPLNVVPGDRTLKLAWQPNAGIGQVVDHYEVRVACVPGANPPAQGACNSAINAGSAITLTLSGLTNDKPYTSTVSALNVMSSTISMSHSVTATPAKPMVYLPLINR